MNRKEFIWNIFNMINVFIVTFDQFNKTIFFLKEKISDPNIWMCMNYTCSFEGFFFINRDKINTFPHEYILIF